MLSFIQMAAALSGAGGGDDSVVKERESSNAVPTGSITDPVEQSDEGEPRIQDTEDNNDAASVTKTSTDETNTLLLTAGDNFNGKALTVRQNAIRYSEGDDFSREGSVDVDSLVHAQLDSEENASANEKSWDEELREALKQDKNVDDLNIDQAEIDKKDNRIENSADDIAEITNETAIVSESAGYKTIEINVQVIDPVDYGTVTAVEDLYKDIIMPETREEIDGAVSPSLMFANCRYRWEKAIITQSQNVVFVTINKKDVEPIKLSWSDSSRCYYSEEFKIPVGTYVGNLVIDGNFYPVEDITIKHYTFEVDLYLKDEIIQDEQAKHKGVEKVDDLNKPGLQSNGTTHFEKDTKIDSFSYIANRDYNYPYTPSRAHMESDRESATGSVKSEASGINLSSKYQDLVRSQMSNKNSFLDQDSDNEVSHSLKSDHSDLDDGRRTPVGEDGAKQYQDGDDTAIKKLNMEYAYRSIDDQTTFSDLKTTILDSNTTATSPHLARQADNVTSSIVDDVLGNGHARTPIYSTETPVHSKNSSAHSSARQTPQSDMREQVRPESRSSVMSANSVSRHVLDDLLDNALGRDRSSPKSEAVKEGSVHSLLSKTPPPEQIDDVLNPADRHSPIRRDFLNSSHHVPNISGQNSAQNSLPGSGNNSQRQTPQKEMISDILHASREKLYNSQDIRKLNHSDQGSPHSSSHHSNHSSSSLSSRPQSLTSEQELTQYYENSADTQKVLLSNETTVLQRTSSASSLPVIGAQRHTPDKRSMTPDNHVRIPGAGSILKGPLLPGRTTPRTPLSAASSRTVTPVNVQNEGQEVKLKEQIKELENTVSSLRRLLASSEQEVVELNSQFEEVKGLNQKLQAEVDRLRTRPSPGPQIAEYERKYRETLEEQDRLKSEIELLREELRSKEQPSLNSYDPNSPAALQRKIDDLTSQIQDLQEANETSVAELSAAEKKVKELAEENERLRIVQSSSIRQVEDENRILKNENARLKETNSSLNDATEHRLKIELQQIRDENRNLRERNYQLHDDNIKLREETMNLRKSFELMDTSNRTYKEEKKSQKTVEDYIREDRSKLIESSYQSERSSNKYRVLDPLPIYQRSERLAETHTGDEEEKTYKSFLKSAYDTKTSYDTYEESLKTERTYNLEHDLLKNATNDHLARSDSGRYQKSNSYGSLEIDRLAQSEKVRYSSDYRTMPDGGSGDRLRPSPPKYDIRPRTPERPAALSSTKKDISHSCQVDRMKYERLERSEMELSRKEPSRTSSAEIDYRSMPSYASDLTKTMPTLSGRSKEIYAEITDKRLKERNQSNTTTDTAQLSKSESDENKEEQCKNNQSPCNSPATSAQVFVNRFVPQNATEQTPPPSEGARLFSVDRGDVTYSRTAPALIPSQNRQVERDEKDYEVRGSVYPDDGDMSDTATDILVNAQPLDKITTTWAKTRPRRGSLGSDGSDFSDIDEQLTSAMRKRSKSADGREVLRRMAPTGSSHTRGGESTQGKGDRAMSRTLSPGRSNAGLRSVTPRPLATQHNKTSLSIASSLNTLTQGLRPFAPRSPQDLQVNDVIKFSRQGGKLSQGTIKFIGHLPGRGDIYLGVELDKEDGKHDGVFEDVRYFKCKPSKGVFVAYNKVVMAWTSY